MRNDFLHITYHSYVRAKERVGIKNEKELDLLLSKALVRGKRIENLNRSRDVKIFEKISINKDKFPVAYNGYCFIFSNESHKCITIYRLPKYFDKKMPSQKKASMKDYIDCLDQVA